MLAHLHPHSLLAVDIDGTLCHSEYWGKGTPKPIKENIAIVKKLYFAGYHIVIYTARNPSFRMVTEHWLQKNGVWYHALVMGERKMGFDLLIDDKAINSKDFFDGNIWEQLTR